MAMPSPITFAFLGGPAGPAVSDTVLGPGSGQPGAFHSALQSGPFTGQDLALTAPQAAMVPQDAVQVPAQGLAATGQTADRLHGLFAAAPGASMAALQDGADATTEGAPKLLQIPGLDQLPPEAQDAVTELLNTLPPGQTPSLDALASALKQGQAATASPDQAIMIPVAEAEGLPLVNGEPPAFLVLVPEDTPATAVLEGLPAEAPILFAALPAQPIEPDAGGAASLVLADGTPVPLETLREALSIDEASLLTVPVPEPTAEPVQLGHLLSSGPSGGEMLAEGLAKAAVDIVPATDAAGSGRTATQLLPQQLLHVTPADGQSAIEAAALAKFTAGPTDAVAAELFQTETINPVESEALINRLRAALAEIAAAPVRPQAAADAAGRPGEQILVTSVIRDLGPPSSQIAAPERAAPPPPPPPAQQLAFRVGRAIIDGNTRMTVQLDPPELGRVAIRLDFQVEGAVRAQIAADRPETLDLLQRDARFLERALQDAGVRTDGNSLNFSLNQQGQGGEFGQSKSGQANFADILENPDAAEEPEVEDAEVMIDVNDLIGADLSGGVNIVI